MAMDDERQVNEQETTGPEREPLSVPSGGSKSPGVGRKPGEKAQGNSPRETGKKRLLPPIRHLPRLLILLAVLRRLSRRMLERIDRNYRTILPFNTALLLLGLGGVLRPTTTAMLHNLSTMAVAAGSMRLYLKEEDGKRQTKQTALPASRQGSGRRRGSL